jgi:hypothetical protein
MMMRATGLTPDNTTVLGLLFGCKHAGLVDEENALFKTTGMEQPGILKAEHYACVVDLPSHVKRFDDSKGFLEELPFEPGIGFWKALVGGCVRFTGTWSWLRVLQRAFMHWIHRTCLPTFFCQMFTLHQEVGEVCL